MSNNTECCDLLDVRSSHTVDFEYLFNRTKLESTFIVLCPDDGLMPENLALIRRLLVF